MLLWLQLEEKGALFKFLTAQLSSWIGNYVALRFKAISFYQVRHYVNKGTRIHQKDSQ